MVTLVAILGATIAFAVAVWRMPGESMSGGIVVSMVLGVVFSLIVGVGLMSLLFYSSRKGYDQPPEIIRNDEDTW